MLKAQFGTVADGDHGAVASDPERLTAPDTRGLSHGHGHRVRAKPLRGRFASLDTAATARGGGDPGGREEQGNADRCESSQAKIAGPEEWLPDIPLGDHVGEALQRDEQGRGVSRGFASRIGSA
jgi:hypothetical protein